MTTGKLEQAARQAFETWWEREGQEFLFALNTTTDDDIKLVAEIAWKNGAYCAEQAEQEQVALLQLAEDALVYHAEQTRPIQNTIDALAAIQKFKEKQR